MSRAEKHGWYDKVDPWTEEQLGDYFHFHGMTPAVPAASEFQHHTILAN